MVASIAASIIATDQEKKTIDVVFIASSNT